MASMLAAAVDAMPRFSNRSKKSNWWNRKLEMERKYVRKLRRRINKRCTQEERNLRLLRCRQARNKYFNLVRQTKRLAWVNFLTEEGRNDPWGLPYKIAMEKRKEENIMCSMKFDGVSIRD